MDLSLVILPHRKNGQGGQVLRHGPGQVIGGDVTPLGCGLPRGGDTRAKLDAGGRFRRRILFLSIITNLAVNFLDPVDDAADDGCWCRRGGRWAATSA